MKKPIKLLLFSLTLLLNLNGCGKSPGRLEGVWQATGILPMKIIFRSGEEESMGLIEHVSYKNDGNAVIVTYEDGMMKGTSMKYTLVDNNTAVNQMFTLKRVR